MASKKKTLRKTLPKDFEKVLEEGAKTGDYAPTHAVLEGCVVDARGGYGKETTLSMDGCTPDLARWLVARGADVDAVDLWGNTALHHSARARFGHRLPPEVLIELGADVHKPSKSGLSPLHAAADGQNHAAVMTLLAHGANVDAIATGDLTPLEYALQRISNVGLVAMVPVAEALLAAGARTTPRAREFVKRAAETFEFHRAGFHRDSVDETAAASRALCALFGVDPPAPRTMHATNAPIVTTATTWQKRHAELWQLLVPSRGACETVQGEVIRIAGRVGDELYRNGGGNWDRDYDAMLKAFCGHVASLNALSTSEIAECKAIAARGSRNEGSIDRLAELAVAWVVANPTPVPLVKPAYSR